MHMRNRGWTESTVRYTPGNPPPRPIDPAAKAAIDADKLAEIARGLEGPVTCRPVCDFFRVQFTRVETSVNEFDDVWLALRGYAQGGDGWTRTFKLPQVAVENQPDVMTISATRFLKPAPLVIVTPLTTHSVYVAADATVATDSEREWSPKGDGAWHFKCGVKPSARKEGGTLGVSARGLYVEVSYTVTCFWLATFFVDVDILEGLFPNGLVEGLTWLANSGYDAEVQGNVVVVGGPEDPVRVLGGPTSGRKDRATPKRSQSGKGSP